MKRKSSTILLLLVFCLLSVSLISENAQSENICRVSRNETVPASTSGVGVAVTATLSDSVYGFHIPLKFKRGDDQDTEFELDSIVLGDWLDTSGYAFFEPTINNTEKYMHVWVQWMLNMLPPGSGTLFTMYFTTEEFWDPEKGVTIDTTSIYWSPIADPYRLAFFLGPEQDYDTLDVAFEKGSLGPTWIREIESEGAQLPQEFALGQNYPNPFNPTTVIRFALPEDGQVKIDVFNVLGQRVTTLVDEYLTAGYKETGWDGKDSKGAAVGSGIYFYRIWTERFSEVRKMILLK